MKIHIISGFTGAGKTTFLNRYIRTLEGTKAVIVNDDGYVQLDKDITGELGAEKSLDLGCICCTLASDFKLAIRELAESVHPDNLLVEAAGIVNLSDVEKVCREVSIPDISIARRITLVEACSYEAYIDGMGYFYPDQIANADVILLTHLDDEGEEYNLDAVVEGVKAINNSARIQVEDYRELSDKDFLKMVNE